ncbi:MAG: CbtB-domain containing protein [Mariprofundaceae bacterium]
MSMTTMMQQTMTQSHAKTSVRTWAERILWLTWVPLVLFTVFFASIPDVHNGMHPVRHAATIVQCH